MSIDTSGRHDNAPNAEAPATRAKRRLAILVSLCLTVLGAAVFYSPAAQADTDPEPGVPPTVSADALPTWQVNGVVWSQTVVGNKVFATGSFTQARPPGVPAGGAGSIAANNLFVYDITTGEPVPGFQHSLNAQGLVVKASPDGTRVYVGGDFTSVDGVARGHMVALRTDNGAIDTSFNVDVSSAVRGIAVSNDTVYAGGNFFRANGTWLRRLAAFSRSDGARRNWAPTADDYQVETLVMSPDGSKVIIGGRFTTISGSPANGIGAVDADTGQLLPFAADQQIKNGGERSAILGLSSDGVNVYGTGFAFGTGNFEGVFSVRPNSGEIVWANGCHGDTYDTFANATAVYSVSHMHDCRWIGSFPEVSPRRWIHAQAFGKDATGVGIGPDNYGWNFDGVPTSSLLQWFPDPAIGSYTGQAQAGWSLAGNEDYVVMGGEFPRVNGVAQQGLVRFTTKVKAPNKRGPVQAADAQSPAALSFAGGEARVSWQASYDMDNEKLTYEVFRSGTAEPVYSTTQKSNFWTHPTMGFVDRSLAPGANVRYTIRVTDSSGNVQNLTTNQVTVASGSASDYSQGVIDDGASAFWRLGEPSGSLVYDYAGFNDGTAQSGVSRGAEGAIEDDNDGASTFAGNSDGFVVSPEMETTPSFTVEAWVKTSSQQGGKIIGYGNRSSGNSSSYDRHVYMDNSGRITFGVYPGSIKAVRSGDAYNDGEWHHVVASMSENAGIKLFVDGKKVASDSSTTSAQSYSGHWRIGGDNLNGWPNRPSSRYLSGTIDDVAVYPSALSLAKVQAHYTDSGRVLDVPPRPDDAYGQTVYDDSPELFWRLDESTGSAAKDSGVAENDGLYSGGYTLGEPAGVNGTPGSSVAFDGSSGGIGSESTFVNPTTYSEELWFKTSTDQGGKLIGFGNEQSGNSSSYDRHVYMQNSGQLTFGVWTGTQNTTTSDESYNDDAWHHMVATQSSDGMKLYVDGELVGTNAQTAAQDYTGYWRVGGDVAWAGSSNYFDGTIDEVAVYADALGQDAIQAHFLAGGGDLPNQLPGAEFDASTSFLNVSVDGSASSDPDGSIDSYDWDWGDGSTHGSGQTAEHTYDSPGDYTVVLTVTDDEGETATSSQEVTVVANQPPEVEFTSLVDGLGISVDGSASSDPDGSIDSYDWDWGDGSANGSGQTAEHSYNGDGTYTVTLTVTDDQGATTSSTKDVAVERINQAPEADFTATVDRLAVSVDASGSFDPDGSIASYDWAWGDGSANGSGQTADHTYVADGNYPVTLTVTDDEGKTATIEQVVTVASTPQPLLLDAFERAVSGGWGAADVGGDWSRTGPASSFEVANGMGKMTMPNPGTGRSMDLTGAPSDNADVTLTAGADEAPTGGGIYVTIRPREIDNANHYYGKLRLMNDGRTQLIVGRRVGGNDSALDATIVQGLTLDAEERVNVRVQTFGIAPTTVRAKVWKVGDAEPNQWTVSSQDGSAALQTVGTLELRTYLSGSATTSPMSVEFDDLSVQPTQ